MRNDFSWNLYFQYKGKQMELKYVNSEMRKGNDGSGINYDIWIPKTYEEWFNKIKFPRKGLKK